jgi:endonuclease/exonuclease/phosphatase family metal-dependent hydrolase
VDRPYVKGITGTTIIDFFVVSPNVEILSVKTLGNNFAWSDHQPVLMKVRLRL